MNSLTFLSIFEFFQKLLEFWTYRFRKKIQGYYRDTCYKNMSEIYNVIYVFQNFEENQILKKNGNLICWVDKQKRGEG